MIGIGAFWLNDEPMVDLLLVARNTVCLSLGEWSVKTKDEHSSRTIFLVPRRDRPMHRPRAFSKMLYPRRRRWDHGWDGSQTDQQRAALPDAPPPRPVTSVTLSLLVALTDASNVAACGPCIMHMMSASPVLLCQHALGATRCGARLPVPSAETAPQPAMKLTALRRASAPPRAPRAPPCRATRRTPAPPPIRQRPHVSPGASQAPRPSLRGTPRARP